jgi:hypothetical protein
MVSLYISLILPYSECAEFYYRDVTFDLFKLCIENNNEKFLAHALLTNIFPSKYVDRDEVIKKLLDDLASGAKTDLYLNMLNFANFSKWH